jgi:hypothetical protein
MIPYYADNKFEEHDMPALPVDLKIAFIGNSLTLHAPGPDIGWPHDHGMAASRQEGDYAHLLLKHLRLGEGNAYIRNFYPFESDAGVAPGHMASLAGVFAARPAIIVIQLGDNIGTQEQLNNFAANMQLLTAAACSHGKHVFCVSSWWQSPPKDYVIERVCQIHGANYVFIGDLFGDAENTDRRSPTYAHGGVEAHPKDWGMAQIAERLHRAILGRLLAS